MEAATTLLWITCPIPYCKPETSTRGETTTEVLDKSCNHGMCLHNMEERFGEAKITRVSFDNNTSVGCMLHDTNYTIKDL